MKNMKILSFLVRSPTKLSKVVPLSEQSSFKRINLSFKERRTERVHVSAIDLLGDVAELVTSQKNVLKSVSKYDQRSISEYLEDGADLLDVCNSLVAKLESVRRYGDSVKRAVDLGMSPRVKELLDTKRYCHDDVSVGLKRLAAKEKRRRKGEGEDDSLMSSLNDTVEKCRRLDTALTLKKGRRSCGGGCMEQMVELRDLIGMGKKMRDRTVEIDGEIVKSKCEEVVDLMVNFEDRVKELYKELVCIRMALLGIVSYY